MKTKANNNAPAYEEQQAFLASMTVARWATDVSKLRRLLARNPAAYASCVQLAEQLQADATEQARLQTEYQRSRPATFVFEREFPATGSDFRALEQAKAFVQSLGCSVGRPCDNMPLGVRRGDHEIFKWKNLDDKAKDSFDGQIVPIGDFRTGGAKVRLRFMPQSIDDEPTEDNEATVDDSRTTAPPTDVDEVITVEHKWPAHDPTTAPA